MKALLLAHAAGDSLSALTGLPPRPVPFGPRSDPAAPSGPPGPPGFDAAPSSGSLIGHGPDESGPGAPSAACVPRAPTTDPLPVCMLTIGDRQLVEHTLDELAAAGIEEVIVTLPTPTREQPGLEGGLEEFLGHRTRPTLPLRLVHIDEDGGASKGADTIAAVDGSALLAGETSWLEVRADIMRSPCIGEFLRKAALRPGRTVVARMAGGASAGLRLVYEQWTDNPESVTLDGHAVLVDSPAAFHRAQLDDAAGRFVEPAPWGRPEVPDLVVGEGSIVPRSAIVRGPVRAGCHVHVKPDAQLRGPVVLGDRAVVENDVALENVVVMPDAIVGPRSDLRSAIACRHGVVAIDSTRPATSDLRRGPRTSTARLTRTPAPPSITQPPIIQPPISQPPITQTPIIQPPLTPPGTPLDAGASPARRPLGDHTDTAGSAAPQGTRLGAALRRMLRRLLPSTTNP